MFILCTQNLPLMWFCKCNLWTSFANYTVILNTILATIQSSVLHNKILDCSESNYGNGFFFFTMTITHINELVFVSQGCFLDYNYLDIWILDNFFTGQSSWRRSKYLYEKRMYREVKLSLLMMIFSSSWVFIVLGFGSCSQLRVAAVAKCKVNISGFQSPKWSLKYRDHQLISWCNG